jgi:hypothetical protein
MPGGGEKMSRKKMTAIALLIGAVIVLAGGSFALLSDHMKTGYGLLVLGVILMGVSLFTFFRPPNEGVQLDREWM